MLAVAECLLIAFIPACSTSEPEPAILMDLAPRANLLKACEKLDDMVACANLGLDYQNGTNGDVNVEGAKRVYKKACDGGILGACNNLGNMLAENEPADAFAFFRKACGSDRPKTKSIGCANAAEMIATQRVPDHGAPEALSLYRRACEVDHATSCYNASALILGTDPRSPEGIELRTKACNLGVKEACSP